MSGIRLLSIFLANKIWVSGVGYLTCSTKALDCFNEGDYPSNHVQDETARVVMYENQSWLPVASLFGLVGCSVPRDLKAEILLTLAAFALSPEIASNMWVTLEVSQVSLTLYQNYNSSV